MLWHKPTEARPPIAPGWLWTSPFYLCSQSFYLNTTEIVGHVAQQEEATKDSSAIHAVLAIRDQAAPGGVTSSANAVKASLEETSASGSSVGTHLPYLILLFDIWNYTLFFLFSNRLRVLHYRCWGCVLQPLWSFNGDDDEASSLN